MSETANIAALAATVSEKLFSTFGWKMLAICDENFTCSKADKHQTVGSGGKHPTDCVFAYDDPFSNKSIFLHCDLKSYAKSTIKTTDFAPYIRGLARAIDCASSSSEWKDRYIAPEISDWKIEGLLFVYNHDQDYDSDFKEKAKGLSPGSLPHNRSSRIHLLGPDNISYLQSISADIKVACADHDLSYKDRLYFYPQQIIHPPGESLLPTATIESLRGKLLIVAIPSNGKKDHHFIAYLKAAGEVSDFEYLITYLYRKGIMALAECVKIKGVDFSANAQVNFGIAKEQFLKRHYSMIEIKNSLERIHFGRADRVTSSFSSIDESLARKK